MRYGRLTIALALPRSGTYWTTRFLRPGLADAWHDPLGPLRGDVDALRARVDAQLAADPGRLYLADTGGVLWAVQLRRAFPHARWAFILRDQDEVARSLTAAGAPLADHTLRTMRRALLEAIAAVDSPVIVKYRRPFDRDGARRLWRQACDTRVGEEWLDRMRGERLALTLEEQQALLA